METIGASVARRTLAGTLTQLRKTAGVSVSAVAERLGCTEGKVRHNEAGRNIPDQPDIEVMLTLYQRPDLLEDLIELRKAAREPGWWVPYRLPARISEYVAAETDAVQVRCFALELIPGLLQTQEYARKILTLHGSRDAELDRRVAARMKRQDHHSAGQSVDVVLSESVLHRTAGMGDVGAAQLQHLSTVDQTQGVRIRVVSFDQGMHRSMSGSYTLLDFPPESEVPPLGYLEYTLGAHLEDSPQVVGQMEGLFAELWEQSTALADSPVMKSLS